MSDKVRRIRLRHSHLFVEDGRVSIRGQTEGGVQHGIELVGFDSGRAVCALKKIGHYLAEEIGKERFWHNIIRGQARDVWGAINAQIEGEKRPT